LDIIFIITEGTDTRFPSDIEIGGFYTASFVDKSDDKVNYKLTDHDISAASPLDLMDGTVEQCLIPYMAEKVAYLQEQHVFDAFFL
jgi:hypothetical protein